MYICCSNLAIGGVTKVSFVRDINKPAKAMAAL